MDEERKHLTILFADLVNSTDRIADRDPEVALDLLRPAIRAMAEAVHRFGGTVNHTMGDGLMAMFGAPRAIGEHALNAVRAGLEMHRLVGAMKLGLELRVGIHSGEVVLHRLDATGHPTLEAAGEPVHLAARIQEATQPGRTWISDDTLRLLRGTVLARPVVTAVLRGFRQPVAVYEVDAVDALPGAILEQGGSPFVDRETELAVLRAALARAHGGEGHAVALVGDPGIGKSRLVREFLAEIGDSARVERTSCAQWRSDTGFHPILGLTRRLLGLEGDETATLTRERVSEALSTLGLPADLVPALCALHGVDPGADWAALSPARRRSNIVEACRALLIDAAARRPLVVVIDDLHWADPETEALIERVLDGLDRAALLLLLGWRPDYAPGWAARPHLTRLAVPPLAPADAATLTRSVLGARGDDDRLVETVASRAGGNPFFIEEAAKLADPGAVPPSVRGLLAERIDRLPEAGKRFVEVVAAVGEPVSPSLVQVVLGTRDEAEEELARALERAGVLQVEGHGAAARCSCRHSLLAEVAYGGLTQQRRRDLHARIARAQEDAAPRHRTTTPRCSRATPGSARTGRRRCATRAQPASAPHCARPTARRCASTRRRWRRSRICPRTRRRCGRGSIYASRCAIRCSAWVGSSRCASVSPRRRSWPSGWAMPAAWGGS
jgi:class 3 adenylate cyclase